MTPIERINSHLDLAVDCRRMAIAVRRDHDPMVLKLVVNKGEKTDLKDELDTAMKILSKLVRKFIRGEAKEKTVKAAQAKYITLMRNSKDAIGRMRMSQESVEHWEGCIQAHQIDMDIVELDNARMRRAS